MDIIFNEGVVKAETSYGRTVETEGKASAEGVAGGICHEAGKHRCGYVLGLYCLASLRDSDMFRTTR